MLALHLCCIEHVNATWISFEINKVLSYLISQPQPDTTNTTSDLSSPETLSNSSLKFSHHLSGVSAIPLCPHFFPAPTTHPEHCNTPWLQPPSYPPRVIPFTQSLHWLLVLNIKSCCWQTELQWDPYRHITRPPSRPSHTRIILFCHHWPFSSPTSIYFQTGWLSPSVFHPLPP